MIACRQLQVGQDDLIVRTPERIPTPQWESQKDIMNQQKEEFLSIQTVARRSYPGNNPFHGGTQDTKWMTLMGSKVGNKG